MNLFLIGLSLPPMKIWIKQVLGFVLVLQLVLLPHQGAFANLFELPSAAMSMEQMQRIDVAAKDAGMMNAMDCMQEHNMSGGDCTDHNCPSCQCASCLLLPLFQPQVHLYNSVLAARFILHDFSSLALEGLYRPPRL
ncbi:MAG: hypothetical protein Q9O24_12250 [Gammaproteobacteria bacterium]|nr:hypothetical protein [Gammaproteobacteria bacterium]